MIYSLIILFIWMNLYYLANITLLDKRFYEINTEAISIKQYIYYLSRVIYWFWVCFGIFGEYKIYFIFLILITFFKYLLFYINKRSFKIMNVVSTFISIIILILLFILNIKLF